MQNEPKAVPSYTASIRHVRAFLTVARCGSFTQAAEQLRISQPALTMAIKQLEDLAHVTLFNRTTRRVTLTSEGTYFLPTAERLLREFDLAIQDIRAAALITRGRLRIGTVHSVATKILPHVVKEFAEQNPNMRLQMREGNSSSIRRQVQRNEIDIGIASKSTDDPDLTFVPFFRDQIGLLMRSDHPLAKRKEPLAWRDLDGFSFVGVTEDTATGPIIHEIADLPAGVRMPRYEVSTNSGLWAMVSGCNGIAATPALSAPEPGSSLTFSPLSEPVIWRSTFIVTRSAKPPSDRARDFITRLRERIAAITQTNPLIQLL